MKKYKTSIEITAESAEEAKETLAAINRLVNNLSAEDLIGVSHFVEQKPEAIQALRNGLTNPKKYITEQLKNLKFW